METGLVVVDEDPGGDVHGGDEHHAFLDAALADELGDGVGDANELPALAGLEGEVFGEGLHGE
ncbi:MAG TPA: hypothetical protein VFZ09_34785 [Archangium sp.]|uniref:hypothetical protein n=1 Tax=Archangium sp. TaxID=1872627 RepID=UPI002E31CBD2|nr:hypothetical protein [Archangium sp.]HEX5751441.1 hypothetical protein [Archangium sp.]